VEVHRGQCHGEGHIILGGGMLDFIVIPVLVLLAMLVGVFVVGLILYAIDISTGGYR